MTNSNFNQLKKGILKMIVLKVLSDGKAYGYELIKKIDKESNGLLFMKEGTLYPILYRLEDDGYIEGNWENFNERNKPKKYYVITENGKKYLNDMIIFWNELVNAVNVFLD